MVQQVDMLASLTNFISTQNPKKKRTDFQKLCTHSHHHTYNYKEGQAYSEGLVAREAS